MMNLVITVMAIALAALLTVGGIHYFDGGVGTRILVSRGLETQLDAIDIAVAAYKASNNGLHPTAVPERPIEEDPRIRAFLPWGKLPPFPKAAVGYRWSRVRFDGKPATCLSTPAGADAVVLDATIRFAANQVARRGQQKVSIEEGLEVVVAENCAAETPDAKATFDTMAEAARGLESIAVIIRER